MATKPNGDWRPINKFKAGKNPLPRRVDVWLSVHASPRSMGMSDSFRVTDAYRKNGKWCHMEGTAECELFADYITHFMERPRGPSGERGW